MNSILYFCIRKNVHEQTYNQIQLLAGTLILFYKNHMIKSCFSLETYIWLNLDQFSAFLLLSFGFKYTNDESFLLWGVQYLLYLIAQGQQHTVFNLLLIETLYAQNIVRLKKNRKLNNRSLFLTGFSTEHPIQYIWDRCNGGNGRLEVEKYLKVLYLLK